MQLLTQLPHLVFISQFTKQMSSYSYPENITPDTEGVEPKTMTIGINNVFEVGCSILED